MIESRREDMVEQSRKQLQATVDRYRLALTRLETGSAEWWQVKRELMGLERTLQLFVRKG
jgi:hypothetical protein